MSIPDITAGLRICGDDLSPIEISQILGCAASQSHAKGETVRTEIFNGVAPTGVWIKKVSRLDGNLDSTIEQLLSEMTNSVQSWNSLADRYRIDLFCGVFITPPNQGFSLKSETLGELAKRKIALSFDLYTTGPTSQ